MLYMHIYMLVWCFCLFCYYFWFHIHTSINSSPYFRNKGSISIIFSLVKLKIDSSYRFTRYYSPDIRFYCIRWSSLALVFFRVHFFLSTSVIFSIINFCYHTRHKSYAHTTRLNRFLSSRENDLHEAFSCSMSMLEIEEKKIRKVLF
jgi:hypothetical protein